MLIGLEIDIDDLIQRGIQPMPECPVEHEPDDMVGPNRPIPPHQLIRRKLHDPATFAFKMDDLALAMSQIRGLVPARIPQ